MAQKKMGKILQDFDLNSFQPAQTLGGGTLPTIHGKFQFNRAVK